MIILNDRQYPLFVMKIDKYFEFEYKTLKKNMEYIDNKSCKDEIYINLHIDLYNLEDYSTYYITKTINYLTDKYYKYINSVKIFMNKSKTSYITEAFLYMHNNLSEMIKIKIIDTPLLY